MEVQIVLTSYLCKLPYMKPLILKSVELFLYPLFFKFSLMSGATLHALLLRNTIINSVKVPQATT